MSQPTPDQETQFSTNTGIVPKSNSDTIYSTLEELNIEGASIYAFLRFPQVWKAFMDWRHQMERGMNKFQLEENKKFDELIARLMRNKGIIDDKTLYEELLLEYMDTGARKVANRIRVVVGKFKAKWQEDHNKTIGEMQEPEKTDSEPNAQPEPKKKTGKGN